MRKHLFLLSVALFGVNLLGIAYMHAVFSSTSQEEVLPSTREASTSTALILPVAFIAIINLYIFFFRFRSSLKLLKIYFFVVAILAWAVVSSTLLGYLGFGSVWLYVFLTIAPLALLRTSFRPLAENLLAVSLSCMAGASLAIIFSLKALLVATAMLSLLDYYFVLREEKIVQVAEKFRKAEIPIGIVVGGREGLALGFGDLIFSTAMVVATFVEAGLLHSFAMALTISLSLFAYLDRLLKKGKPLPALPPVFAGALIGAVAGRLL